MTSLSLLQLVLLSQSNVFQSKSTTSNLVAFIKYELTTLKEGLIIDCVYLHLTETFDRVNTDKLQFTRFSIDYRLLMWQRFFFTIRKHFVYYEINNILFRTAVICIYL